MQLSTTVNQTMSSREIADLLNYNPVSGIFTWIVNRCGKAKMGHRAGSLNGNGYVYITVMRKRFPAHRLAFLLMTGELPAGEIDHINRIRHDNRWSNLRRASSRENKMNAGISRNNTSGVTGVCWHKKAKKWHAQITINRANKSLGLFINKADAISARRLAEEKYFLEYAPNKSRVNTRQLQDAAA